jgi:two-component system, NarL family, nitrate/nitrite response regulator NarL
MSDDGSAMASQSAEMAAVHPRDDPGPMPRVAIVDADRRVQQSLADALRLTGRVKVVGCAGDPRTALELMAAQEPSVVLVDPRLPDVQAANALLNGIQLGWPMTRIVLMGWSNPLENPELARRAATFVAKNAQPDEFVDAVLNACGCF